jgi:hypothetical protein
VGEGLGRALCAMLVLFHSAGVSYAGISRSPQEKHGDLKAKVSKMNQTCKCHNELRLGSAYNIPLLSQSPSLGCRIVPCRDLGHLLGPASSQLELTSMTQ